jgi:putative flavoprotein involved in K+ transport
VQQPAVSRRIERYDTIVIGGGQSGLAVGRELQRRDADFVILEGGLRIGDSWRRRWDSLRLFTPAKYCGLPGMPFPAAPHAFPDKDQVGDYLESYADRFDLPVRLGVHVRSLRRSRGHYVLVAGDVQYEAANVVVATGPFQSPRIPAIAAQLSAQVHQLHSSGYVNPHLLPDGPALVVGVGNSGVQIAMELSRFRAVTLAGHAVAHTPRSLVGRDVYDWIWPVISRLTAKSAAGRALRTRLRRGDPVVGITKGDLAAAGVKRVGRLTGVENGVPVCEGRPVPAAVVMWATGFAPQFDWIELPIFNPDGSPQHEFGVVRETPGLYFLGLRFQRSYTSGLLGGVGTDAVLIAEQIAGAAI